MTGNGFSMSNDAIFPEDLIKNSDCQWDIYPVHGNCGSRLEPKELSATLKSVNDDGFTLTMDSDVSSSDMSVFMVMGGIIHVRQKVE